MLWAWHKCVDWAACCRTNVQITFRGKKAGKFQGQCSSRSWWKEQQKGEGSGRRGGRGREKTDQAAAVPVCVCGNKQQAAGQKAIVQFARRNEATIERTETKQRRNASGTA